jgi:Protein of unknown function (DUF3830)
MLSTARMTIDGETFDVQLQYDKAPRSCAFLERLLSYHGKLIHAQWSGQACWSPLSGVWTPGSILAPENATSYPALGQVLLFGGALSEPELLIAYGPTHFASKAGSLAGNPVLIIGNRLERIAELGRQILWGGAVDIRIESLEGRKRQ